MHEFSPIVAQLLHTCEDVRRAAHLPTALRDRARELLVGVEGRGQRYEEDTDIMPERIVETRDDAASTATGAATLIQTIVWSIVVLVLLAVGLYALHVYLHLF
jgi:hypothetical protein